VNGDAMLQNISGAGTQRTPAVISTQQLPVASGKDILDLIKFIFLYLIYFYFQ